MITLLRNIFKRNKIPSCQQVNQFLHDYIDDQLDPKTKQQFQSHLSKCKNCHVYLEQYQTTVELLNDQPKLKPPEELINHTLAFLKENLINMKK